mgnify:CR=1 FL=1
MDNHKHTSSKLLIHGLLREEILALCRELGQPDYRAEQIWKWLYVQRMERWGACTNLPKPFLAELANRFRLPPVGLVEIHGPPAGTRKLLVELPDGERVEEVLIPARSWRTVCVSSQVGCRFHCAFCASGQAGFRRHLEAGEMVGEILLAAQVYGQPPTHVVFMGIGEPLDNYDAVLRTIRIINDKQGLAIGARRITISTCGLAPAILRLAEEGLQVELSVSLHATNDELRSRLMPINRKYPLATLLDACRTYFERTKRLITFEYVLIRGVNDTPNHVRELVDLLSGLQCRVNLIPLSPVAEFAGEASRRDVVETFLRALQQAGINATVRVSKGCEVKGACGQLRLASRAAEAPQRSPA